MKQVLVFGTFDRLHEGHKYFLRQSKRHGNFLIVVVSRNITVKMQKGRVPMNDEKVRLESIKKLNVVDKALLGEKEISYNLIKKIKPDVICIGYDQMPLVQAKNILKSIGMRWVALKKIKAFKPKIYKSSLMHTKKIFKN